MLVSFITFLTLVIRGHQDTQGGDGVNSSHGMGISQATLGLLNLQMTGEECFLEQSMSYGLTLERQSVPSSSIFLMPVFI